MYKPSKPYKHKIIEEIKKTWHTPHVKISFNTYPMIQRKFSYPEVDHTDGIGTKGVYHWKKGTFRAAVIDALAMNLNDLAIVRAVPYKLSNHIMVPGEDIRVFKIVKALSEECRKRGIAIVGGENSFHDNMKGLDISMTISGFIKKQKPNKFRGGDILIGLKSSGLHSNGITTARKVFKNKFRKEFVVPTVIYLDTILTLTEKYDIHGMMHITGGAFTKLKDIIDKEDVIISHTKKLKPQPIFYEIYKRGISNKNMYTTFNCGIGFIISTNPRDAAKIIAHTKNADIIGKVVAGTGLIKIQSAFNGKEVML